VATDALVVDASVAVKWLLRDEEHAREALLVLERFADGQLDLFAPSQIRYEVPSAIAVATRQRQPRLSPELGRLAIVRFLGLPISTVDDDQLIVDAYALSHRFNVALYDALYLALSERLDLPMIFADRKLRDRLPRLGSVLWIASYR
jgi:predicted nucleic acid-binding protein